MRHVILIICHLLILNLDLLSDTTTQVTKLIGPLLPLDFVTAPKEWCFSSHQSREAHQLVSLVWLDYLKLKCLGGEVLVIHVVIVQ